MNNLPSSPAYYLGPISRPVLPAHRMDNLKEREPSRAGDLYTAEIGQTVNTMNSEKRGQVDNGEMVRRRPGPLPNYSGREPKRQTDRRALQRAYKKAVRIHTEHTQVVDTVNTIPKDKMSDLNERDPARAVNEWQNLPAGQLNSNKVQRNMMKLVMARYSQINSIHYSTILGGPQANAGHLESIIKKLVATITTSWIGTSSWLQAFVEGETCWSDYQVIINNLHRMSKLLKLIPEGETPRNSVQRRTRREAYKKALRAYQEHVRLGAEAEIPTAEDALDDLSTKVGVTQVELQGAWDELASLRGHGEGIIPTTWRASRSGSDGEAVAPPAARRPRPSLLSVQEGDPKSHGHNHPEVALELGGAEAALETAPALRDGVTHVE
ncbi:uncharacterized protein J4E92_010468 [Alternaria infectoria]|uniref:uncharacterized protein n=1 Tax=Alternaria infectoria TaxID=45303 RepID=UPI00221F8B49|nr:uncharacterized protein J4E92_010468 [Alternaria infectoria]KAI4910539.1 hypothetical protein J4E92_010468 [Alternaria infectoria]